MGTRNLTVVIKDGTHKVAQYGQWDGYPSGQGLTCLKFLQGMDKQTLMQQLDAKVSWATPEDIAKKHSYNSRDVAAEILQLIYDAESDIKLVDNVEFGEDRLFCEYTYVVDLDKDIFEVYGSGDSLKVYSLDALPTEEEFLEELEGENDDE